jgi:hypothetical protein
MARLIPCLIIVLLSIGCGGKPGPAKARAEKDPKIAAVEEKVNKTSAEGKQVIEKVKGMKPEVNDQPSSVTLGEKVDKFAKDMANYSITPIGWEASQKAVRKDDKGQNEKVGRWKIIFHYQDYQKNLLAAEWEYNPNSEKLYPFEKVNAPGFWDAPTEPAKDAKAKK